MFHTLFYEPIYNLLAFTLTIVPLHDIGIAIIIVTCIVKAVLLPLNLSSLRAQYLLKKVEDEIKALRESHKSDPQTLSRKTMEVYKREKINPFASLFTLIVQIPILFALYFAFSKGLHNDPKSLYSFISFPETLHTIAFGLFDVTKSNIVIAFLAGASSYFLAKRQVSQMAPPKKDDLSFQAQFAKSMQMQLMYVIPVIVFFSGTAFPSALSLYWFISNVIGYAQDVYIKKKLSHLKK